MKKYLACCLILMLGTVSPLLSKSLRVEPSCWWVGMKEPVFQVLLHGDNVGALEVELPDTSVTLKSVTRAESPNYLFLYLSTNDDTTPGEFKILLKEQNTIVHEIVFPLLARKANSRERKGFDSSDLIYLITPDRFANGDSSNDSLKFMNETGIDRNDPYRRHGGDLQGIIDHLDYLQSMGVTALWINPVLENNQKSSSYHGYAITNFYKVDPRFGDNELYRTLVSEAKKRGIKTIMDQVFNQCGSGHWWMEDLPYKDWINYSENPQYTNHIRTTQQDPYAAIEDYELHTRGWFVDTMPDMNLQNPLLADYLIQNSIWWVEYLGLDGIRQDTYCYPDKYALSKWCLRVMEEYPHFNITGEEWSYNPLILSYWEKGKVNADGYHGNLPSLIDFPLCGALRDAFGANEITNDDSLSNLYLMLSNDHVYPNASNHVVFMSNHDMPRFYMVAHQDPDWYRNALVFLCTTRGIPQLYAGDEVLLTHTGGNGHGFIRRDIPGGWQGDCVSVFEHTGLGVDATDAQLFTQKLLNWRKTADVIHTGKLTHYAPENDVYVYFRYNHEASVMCILNKNEQPVSLDLTRFKRMLKGKTRFRDILNKSDYEIEKVLQLKPKQPLILELE